MERQSTLNGSQHDVASAQSGYLARFDLNGIAVPNCRIHAVAHGPEPGSMSRRQQIAERCLEKVHAALRTQSMRLRSGTNLRARTGTSATIRASESSVNSIAEAS